MKDKKGRGSVSRSLRYYERMKDKEYRDKVNNYSKIKARKRKKRINNRCIDCNTLILPNSKRCKSCGIIMNRQKYLVTLK